MLITLKIMGNSITKVKRNYDNKSDDVSGDKLSLVIITIII